jgi:hypothetical protein
MTEACTILANLALAVSVNYDCKVRSWVMLQNWSITLWSLNIYSTGHSTLNKLTPGPPSSQERQSRPHIWKPSLMFKVCNVVWNESSSENALKFCNYLDKASGWCTPMLDIREHFVKLVWQWLLRMWRVWQWLLRQWQMWQLLMQ